MVVHGCLKCYGSTTVGERGQVVLPAEIRDEFKILPGEKLIVLGTDTKGFKRVVIMKSEEITAMVENLFDVEKFIKEGGTANMKKSINKQGINKK